MSASARPGSLRHRIAIQSRTNVADNQGGRSTSWVAFATVWAQVEPVSAREVYFADKIKHRITHRVVIRYLASVVSSMRVVFGSRVFQVHGVRKLEERSRWLVLDCEEGAAS